MPVEPVPEELVAAAESQEPPPVPSADEHARVLVGRDAVRELAVGREIELVRERFAMEAERVPEPRIAFDESFPDPSIQKQTDAPLLELQQETAAWRAAFVSLEEQPPHVAPPEPVPEPEPPAPSVRKKKRGSKADRDKLRSNAVTLPVPVIVPPSVVPIATPAVMSRPAVQMPAPLYVPPPMPAYGRNQESTYGRSDAVPQNQPVHAPPPPVAAPAGRPPSRFASSRTFRRATHRRRGATGARPAQA